MGKAPAFQFYPGDWVQDTRILTPQTRGIWIDMLCFMWRSSERGKIEGTTEQLARMLSCEKVEIEKAVAELSVTKIADVTLRNDFVTVINRRMFREEKVRKQTRSRVQRFRNADVKRESNGSVTHASSSSSSNTPIIPNLCNDENTSSNGHPPYKEIRSLWAEILPSLPQPRSENNTWHTECRARYREYQRFRDEGVEWVRIFLTKFAGNPWWESGKWKPPGIGWVWKRKNFYSILEAK